MVQLQILSMILETNNFSIVEKYGLTEEYFPTYIEQFKYIRNHYDKYGKVPDKATFLSEFTEFNTVVVNEPEEYLIDALNEEHSFSLFAKEIDSINGVIVDGDTVSAIEHLRNFVSNYKPLTFTAGNNIIDGDSRLKRYEELASDASKKLIETGFQELDAAIGGFKRGEELCVIFARTGQGKTWVMLKCIEHMNLNGIRVGLFEPEMSADSIGYRFDTLRAHFSNTALYRGNPLRGYKQYIKKSKGNTPLFVATPKDFSNYVTVSKLRKFCIDNNLDALAVDGVSYIRDERGNRNDNKQQSLTNVAEDLMTLSNELNIPVIAVVQSNRGGINKDNDDAPDIENIRDSDGIAHNASCVLAVRQHSGDGANLSITLRKSRSGIGNQIFYYKWNFDTGIIEPAQKPKREKSKFEERPKDRREQF